MECDILMLADSAQVAGDKFYVLGGGWTELRVESFPAAYPMAVAIGVLMEPPRITRRCAFSLHILAEATGRRVAETEGEFELAAIPASATGRRRVSMVLNVVPRFDAPGDYSVSFILDGRPVRKTAFSVASRLPRPALARATQERDGALGD